MNEAALKKTFLFRNFSEEQIKKFMDAGKEITLPANNIVFREGDEGNQMFIILMGTVAVLKNREGQDEEMATLGSGSYFGEMAILDDDHQRSASIHTKESTTLLSLTHDAAASVFAHDDHLAHEFFKSLAQGLARRLRHTTQDAAFYKALARSRHS